MLRMLGLMLAIATAMSGCSGDGGNVGDAVSGSDIVAATVLARNVDDQHKGAAIEFSNTRSSAFEVPKAWMAYHDGGAAVKVSGGCSRSTLAPGDSARCEFGWASPQNVVTIEGSNAAGLTVRARF